jgi:hypothetical protein
MPRWPLIPTNKDMPLKLAHHNNVQDA